MLGRVLCSSLNIRSSNFLTQLRLRAILLGCVEPDFNTISYLKGTFRSQFFTGHNYENALPYIKRCMKKLGKKKRWSLWNYFTFGRLLHYIADAFTWPHNQCFQDSVSAHWEHEAVLHREFLLSVKMWNQLSNHTALLDEMKNSARKYTNQNTVQTHIIMKWHQSYLQQCKKPLLDCMYILSVGTAIMEMFPQVYRIG
jgi:hypothetical protein